METESISVSISPPITKVAGKMRDRAFAQRSIASRIISEINSQEMVMVCFTAVFMATGLFAYQRVTEWPMVIFWMSVVLVIISLVNLWSSASPSRALGAVRTFYVIPLIPVFFKTAEYISFPLHGHDFDSALIAADRIIFGVNPTQWIAQHIPLWPSLTEFMMICYSLFFFIPMGLGIELFLKARRKERNGLQAEEREYVNKSFFIVVYGFLLSYSLYFLFPAIGPRFTLHNFLGQSREMQGLFLTDPVRHALDRGENILPGMPLQQILHVVTRDAFPSGHADITLLSIILAFEFRLKIRYLLAVFGTGLIIATVYLRYHYVVDVIGGLVLAIVTLYTWEWVRDRMIILKSRLGG